MIRFGALTMEDFMLDGVTTLGVMAITVLIMEIMVIIDITAIGIMEEMLPTAQAEEVVIMRATDLV